MSREPTSYDFRSPSRFSRERVRALQVVNETFARQMATVLSSTLRVAAHASLLGVQQTTYDDYTRRVPNPSLLCVLSFDSLPGAGVLQMPMDIVMGVIDRLLGGPGGADQPSRALSDIETELIRRLLSQMAHELTYAFEFITPVQAQVSSLESNTQFLQIVPPSDPVVVSEFGLRIGDQRATATFCMPFTTLQPALEAVDVRPATTTSGAQAAAARAVERRLQDVMVEVRVAFREVTITSSEVFALAVGDVLPLRHPTEEPLAVSASGITIAQATPGSHGQRLACQIVSAT